VASLEKLLCESIPPYLDNAAEKTRIISKFKGLASRCKKNNNNKKKQKSEGAASPLAELDEAAVYMSAFLNSSQNSRCCLSATLLADFHSSIGLIREMHGDTQAAMDSYVKALWILRRRRSSGQDARHGGDDDVSIVADLQQVAVIMYRLANLHGRMGDYDQMQELMQQAQVYYNQTSLEQLLYNNSF
jgi:tetratricopeptide (TPR) repeat protein